MALIAFSSFFFSRLNCFTSNQQVNLGSEFKTRPSIWSGDVGIIRASNDEIPNRNLITGTHSSDLTNLATSPFMILSSVYSFNVLVLLVLPTGVREPCARPPLSRPVSAD